VGPAEGQHDRAEGDPRFIARLVAHGPVSEYVPGSVLQTVLTDYVLLGGVADDVRITML
jgi:glucosamine-6-phosphate deaminase